MKTIFIKFLCCFVFFIQLFLSSSPTVASKNISNKKTLFDIKLNGTTEQNNNNSISLGKNHKKFIFTGCAGEEEEFKQVAEIMLRTEEAWNKHQADELLKYYAPDFSSKDGVTLKQIRNNLTEFWLQYPDSKISSLPTNIYVCGGYATASLIESTDAKGNVEDAKTIPFKSQLRALIQGITTLEKKGDVWKITSEEILTEEMQKSYGPFAKMLLDDGKIKLVIPKPVKRGGNYIVQLKYSLPENVQAIAMIDNVLVNEEEKSLKESQTKYSEDNLEALRRNIEGQSPDGLRRLFVFNSAGEDELIRAQMELIAFNKKGPVLVGILGISQRVVSKGESTETKPKSHIGQIMTKMFKEEAS